MLELKNISWSTPDGASVLKDISLPISDNKLVVITGPNGGGKTTLAKIIAGLESPSSGRLRLDVKDITGLDAVSYTHLNRPVDHAAEIPHVGIAHGGRLMRRALASAAASAIHQKGRVFIGQLRLRTAGKLIIRQKNRPGVILILRRTSTMTTLPPTSMISLAFCAVINRTPSICVWTVGWASGAAGNRMGTTLRVYEKYQISFISILSRLRCV